MPRHSPAGIVADMMNLEGEERRRYLAAQRKRAQRARERQAGLVETTVVVPASCVEEIKRIALEICAREEERLRTTRPRPAPRPRALDLD